VLAGYLLGTVGKGIVTPEMTTSYFSSVPFGSNFGVRRGTGGANDGRTRKSREEVEYSVKTGMVEGGEGICSRKKTKGKQLKLTDRSRSFQNMIQVAKTSSPRTTRKRRAFSLSGKSRIHDWCLQEITKTEQQSCHPHPDQGSSPAFPHSRIPHYSITFLYCTALYQKATTLILLLVNIQLPKNPSGLTQEFHTFPHGQVVQVVSYGGFPSPCHHSYNVVCKL
jgi:hypothetical protein